MVRCVLELTVKQNLHLLINVDIICYCLPIFARANIPREETGGLSREYVLHIPSVS